VHVPSSRMVRTALSRIMRSPVAALLSTANGSGRPSKLSISYVPVIEGCGRVMPSPPPHAQSDMSAATPKAPSTIRPSCVTPFFASGQSGAGASAVPRHRNVASMEPPSDTGECPMPPADPLNASRGLPHQEAPHSFARPYRIATPVAAAAPSRPHQGRAVRRRATRPLPAPAPPIACS
jgi:hypothetical protein